MNSVLDMLKIVLSIGCIVVVFDNSMALAADCTPESDCNGNGISDSCDIDAGTSSDCDANGIPDECSGYLELLLDSFESQVVDSQNWQQSPGVTVSTLGIDPPSPPYSLRFNGTPVGEGDQITSIDIDLSSYVTATISYYWQRTGLGDSPEVHDHLFVEFRDSAGTWIHRESHLGGEPDMTVFAHSELTLPPDALHANFAVRFRTTSDAGSAGQAFDDYFLDDIRLTASAASDCNANMIPDSCEITAGELDLDLNGVLDQCQQTRHVPSAYATIQSAIDHANNGDTIIVANGTYNGIGNRNIDTKGKLLTIRSAGGPEHCIIDAGGTETERHRGFYLHQFESSLTTIEGFTITNGWWANIYDTIDATQGGAGMFITNSHPTIRNCIFTGNTTSGSFGGALHLRQSNAILENCTLYDNTGVNLGTLQTGNGGALFIEQSAPLLVQCNIHSNISGGSGGAIHSVESASEFQRCRIASNSSEKHGGALSSEFDSSVTLRHCMITNNSSAKDGAGLRTTTSAITIERCTFSGNHAGAEGGAMMLRSNSTCSVSGSILWANAASNGEEIRLKGSNVSVGYSNVAGGLQAIAGPVNNIDWLDGNIDQDPLFIKDTAADYHLGYASPCINAGASGIGQLSTDIDGDAANIDVSPDMGADETTGLFLSYPMPGLAGVSNLITLQGAAPGAQLYTLIGVDSVQNPLLSCPGLVTSVGLENVITSTLIVDEHGTAYQRGLIDHSLSGSTVWIQGVDPLTCQVSNPLVFVIP